MLFFILMAMRARLPRLLLAVIVMTASFTLGVQRAWAADGDGEEGEIVRQISIVMSYERYEWWLLRWADSQIVCRAFIDHDNWPTADDILLDCGQTVYTEWANTDVCLGATDGSGDTSTCTGLYLFYIGSQMDEKTIVVDLPPPQVYVSLGGCEPTSPENLCPSLPVLVFNAEEPLPNEQVTAIHVVMNDQTYTCEGDVCEVPMQATPLNGTTLEFWSESSFGDESDHFTALVRVVDSGVMLSPAGTGWYVDVLSSQWRGNQVASCAQVWQAFPPVGGPSEWLQTPEAPELLATVEPYSYLAGRLIAQGLVDASGCPGGGLLLNGYADACGTEAAMPVVEQWQNQFDIQILDVAQATGVPAQLMKNIFAQESQFWPGMFRIPYEFGLGQMTDNGAETILLWNPTFYEQFCPLVLDASVCQKGYIYLDSESQAILRGALALESKADCQGCEAGIDLTDIDFSINLFAQTLLANCEQMAQIMYNATGKIAGEVSGYEDLWRFTVANYHVGPGCTSYAMYKAWAARVPMDWAHVASYLTEPCSSAIPYVDSISGIP